MHELVMVETIVLECFFCFQIEFEHREKTAIYIPILSLTHASTFAQNTLVMTYAICIF